MTNTAWMICSVVFLSALFTTSVAMAGSVSAAKSRVAEAKSLLESGRVAEVERTLSGAESFLNGLTPEERAPIEADIKAVRAQLASLPTPEQARALNAAKLQLKSAAARLAEGQPMLAGAALDGTERYLPAIRESDKPAIVAEIKALREQVEAKINPAATKPATPAAPAAPTATPVPAATPAMAVPPPSTLAPAPSASTAPPASVAPAPATATPAPPVAAPPAATPPAAALPIAAPTPVVAAPVAAPASAMTPEQAAAYQRARDTLADATKQVEAGDQSNLRTQTFTIERLARDLPAPEKDALLAESKALTARAAMLADQAERYRRFESELRRHIRNAEDSVAREPRHAVSSIEHIAKRLEDDDIKRTFTPAQMREYHATLDRLKKALAASNKDQALAEADRPMKRIEELLATDPFEGKDEIEAYKAHSSMESWGRSVRGWVRDLPADDADVKAMLARLGAAEAKIEKASLAWGKAKTDAQVGSGWDAIRKDIAGWEQEAVDAKAMPLDTPMLAKTIAAITRIGYFLESDETKKIRAENKGDATLEATYTEAERTRDAAADKLAAAYNAIFAAAEKMETPLRRFDLDRPNLLAVSAETALAGTKQQAPVVARARKLDEKWKAEVAAIMKAREELYNKLAADADKAWPGIVAGLKPVENFDPADASLKGKTILLQGVHNRAGWDWGNDFDFEMRLKGVPVGGTYDPHVLAALKHAWYELKLDVNDRIPWDLVAVVEGPGQVRQRTTVTLRDSRNMEVGKIEEYRPVNGVRLRIVALHAGPVAVGPKN